METYIFLGINEIVTDNSSSVLGEIHRYASHDSQQLIAAENAIEAAFMTDWSPMGGSLT